MEIIRKILQPSQYIQNETRKTGIVVHHTAGGHNPVNVADHWNVDTIGRVATHYIIGGISLQGNKEYNGKIVQCIDEKFWAYHLGVRGNRGLLDMCTIGIELCNFGPLAYANKKFINYVGGVVPELQVVELEQPYRGFKFWHKYTDKQLESLAWLVDDIANRQSIDLSQKGGFDFNKNCVTFNEIKGIYTHTYFRSDKTDCSPQPNLLKLNLI